MGRGEGARKLCVREGSYGVCILDWGMEALGAFVLGEREGIWIVCILRTIKLGIMHFEEGKESVSMHSERKGTFACWGSGQSLEVCILRWVAWMSAYFGGLGTCRYFRLQTKVPTGIQYTVYRYVYSMGSIHTVWRVRNYAY